MSTDTTRWPLTHSILRRAAGVMFASMSCLFHVDVLAADAAHSGHGDVTAGSRGLSVANVEADPMRDHEGPAGYQPAMPAFPLGTHGLPTAKGTETISLNSGDTVEMDLAPVKKKIGGRWLRLLAYNGSVPGPTLRVPQGATITLRLHNRGDTATGLHMHGVRLANAFDGVPGLTQHHQRIGETSEYRLEFPDAGAYWYHPHVRTDYALASGLFGTVVVQPSDTAYWERVNREVVLALSDIALDPSGDRVPFFKDYVDHALMGRFGNTLLVNGDTDHRFTVKRGETVRFYLTNAANARVFDLSIPGVRMKQVGGDLGRYPKSTWVDSVVLAPGQRRVLDVLFEKPGHYPLQHRTPHKLHPLGRVTVQPRKTSKSYANEFGLLRADGSDFADSAAMESYFSMEPKKYLKLTVDMDHALMGTSRAEEHGMHQMPDGTLMHHDHAAMHGEQSEDGIEWEDTMPAMNRASTSQTVVWKMVDQVTGEENMGIDNWQFAKGDRVKIRLFNDPASAHAMSHPIHFHGQRFLVLATNGVRNSDLVWQDTALIPHGATVDMLLDASNPGKWMAHCHIAEHAESGMMLLFQVN